MLEAKCPNLVSLKLRLAVENMGQRGLACGIKVSGEIKSKAEVHGLLSFLSSPLQKVKVAGLSAKRRKWD